ncbi:MAG: carboxyl transferase domain-containing protein [Candidatus Binatia bacterium]
MERGVTFDPICCLGIVNRGEAAVRCLRAVKALRAAERSTLRALALYTEIDRDAPFVRHADVAVALPTRGGGVGAYLDHARVMDALRRGGADAVWPGWGFVAEDPDFADRVVGEGLRFLGPSGATIRKIGDKIAAKQLAQRAGIPVAAWSGGEVAHVDAALRYARDLGYPVVIKAAAGGGGRGIRMVTTEAELAPAFQAATAEASAAFGDGRLFLERRIVGGRHIEVQIAGDAYGRVIALGCRDCSVQRRHQKVIEEAPPTGLSSTRLGRLEAAAVHLAMLVGYCGVGTVEFLVTSAEFYFLEVNPRLQVEHGITEATTGIDLVELQIRIGRGESLPAVAPRCHGVAIEARVCAEDPDAGFLPAPGRVVRFDPPLAPSVRVDTGVVAGSIIPADFDSLVAKVIATGDTREQARVRLACALSDLELVIAGGATNKGYLLDLLAAPEFCAGGIDTTWLDRWAAERARDQFAVEALMVAAILAYQQARHAARLNFYADTANLLLWRVPPSSGQQIDLRYGGEPYQLQVFALGAWRYRVCLDGCAVTATLREDSPHAARLMLGAQILRVLYDVSEASVRVEIEGRPHRFGRQTAGQVCAGTPALVIALHVQPGDRVVAGQPIGLLEAMKMEVAVHAPVPGVVKEVRVHQGEQVAAGDVLLVIDPSADTAADEPGARLRLPDHPDPLTLFFPPDGGEPPHTPDFRVVECAAAAARHAAVAAEREEIRSLLLGYDADAHRGELLLALLDAALPDGLSETFRRELAEIRNELTAFADIEQLFIRTPRLAASGVLRPSNEARLRTFVRRLRAGGAGLAEGFLALLRKALRHYGVPDLSPSDVLQRALLRLLASQRASELRHRLVMGVMRRVVALARSGVALDDDRALAKALARIARMRGQVPDALADAAIEAQHVIFEAPTLERQHARRGQPLSAWLTAAEASFREPPEAVLRQLAAAPRAVFARVEGWFDDTDPRRRAVAVMATLRRLYPASVPLAGVVPPRRQAAVQRIEFPDGRVIVGGVCDRESVRQTLERLCDWASREALPVEAIELIVIAPGRQALVDRETGHGKSRGPDEPDAFSEIALLSSLPARRLTVTVLTPGAAMVHRTFVASPQGVVERRDLHGIHPETAARIDLDRLARFDLERLDSSEDIYSFYGRSREVPGDERVFVLADVRGPLEDEPDAFLQVATFERAFDAATRALRAILGARDQRRRLHWNRIALFVAPEVSLDAATVERMARRLAPATRHLGLEKVVVRLPVIDRHVLGERARTVEIVIADPTGSRIATTWREPHREPLRPASDYERKVAEARRRGVVYPYEILRLLTGGSGGNGRYDATAGDLPSGMFEEYDLDPTAVPVAAVSVAGRPYGLNTGSVVFGIISTPTDKVPEGMRRVLILSDPTVDMGALGKEECDRIVAAIDLAERLRLPLEWLPVSSGARIAIDSGTENLDATARVVRRIVTFTQAGGVIHVIVHGVNVGAQSYFNALSTMLMHTRGVLIMTPTASMVLTGRAALEASGAVSAEDEVAIGGFERIMGPNGEAQYYAHSLVDAYRILYQHYGYTHVVAGEPGPRRWSTTDPADRPVTETPFDPQDGQEFRTVGDVFNDGINPGRKRPFAMRALMGALIDQDGGQLERWRAMAGAEMAIVWDAHLGGQPVCLIGIESQNLPREGYRPLDGPATWSGGTLFPLSSKKVARALNAASGNRPVVILANLSGFDGSPESMRKLQLEYGAEIARAVVNFQGPLLFVVVSRYHGGAYVVFSRALNDRLYAAALEGSYASVIGGSAAAAVVFPREVRARAAADRRIAWLRMTGAPREALERTMGEVMLEKRAELAAEFDAVHTVERARDVGSLHSIIPASTLRPHLIRLLGGGAR